MKRNTQKKQFASASTFAQKWEAELRGGPDATPIEHLAFEAEQLRAPCVDDATIAAAMKKAGVKLTGTEWKAAAWKTAATARLKARFAELMFPAFMERGAVALKELSKATEEAKTFRGNIVNYVLHKNGIANCPKKRDRRWLRTALRRMAPEDRQSLAAVQEYIEKAKADHPRDSYIQNIYVSDSNLCTLLKEMGMPLFKPGEKCQWFVGSRLVREVRFSRNGKPFDVKFKGAMTRTEIENSGNCLYRELVTRILK